MIIYIATNKTNGKRYVGMTQMSLARRIKSHCEAVKRGSQTAFHCAIRSYGIEAFDFEHVASAKDRHALQLAEREIIRQENTMAPNGYNLTVGGDGRIGRMSEQALKNMSAAQLRHRATETEEQKASRAKAISLAKKGKSQPWSNGDALRGTTRSKEFKAKVAAGMKSYTASLPPGEMARRASLRKNVDKRFA